MASTPTPTHSTANTDARRPSRSPPGVRGKIALVGQGEESFPPATGPPVKDLENGSLRQEGEISAKTGVNVHGGASRACGRHKASPIPASEDVPRSPRGPPTASTRQTTPLGKLGRRGRQVGVSRIGIGSHPAADQGNHVVEIKTGTAHRRPECVARTSRARRHVRPDGRPGSSPPTPERVTDVADAKAHRNDLEPVIRARQLQRIPPT
ncbi:MAG: hypothetical protein Ct9H300mP1_29250 [Planctomycetaceae bacterium]|nr:MAG: hypothetical protein Ct9H300mP1_29250 [Planctomycetaceae bacterium]